MERWGFVKSILFWYDNVYKPNYRATLQVELWLFATSNNNHDDVSMPPSFFIMKTISATNQSCIDYVFMCHVCSFLQETQL